MYIKLPFLSVTDIHTEDLLLLATVKMISVECSTAITELVVVWSLCSVCTSVTKSKAVILYSISRFLL